MVRRMILIFCMFFFMQACFPQIHNRNDLFPKKEIGSVNKSNFETEGYYYNIKTDTLYYKHDLQRNGTYNKEKSYYYPIKYLRCLFFSKDGFVLQKDFTTPHVYNQDSVKYYNENLISIFEKKLTSTYNVEGPVKKKDLWFFNKKAQIWNNGIYKVRGDSIEMQLYKNVLGNYYLVRYSGVYKKRSLVFTKEYAYKENKIYHDNLIYEFKKFNIATISNYIRENPKKFWK
ncbi:hypothetical protein [Chryseobacterium indologenes]|nr:hypothetical protein [Chryseobacterium indologenes]